MKTDLKRRDFVSKCFKAGVSGCVLYYGNSIMAQDPAGKVQKPDPESLAYCGLQCSPKCPMYKASIENKTELKKKAYEDFKMKEKFNVDFDPEKIFCFGCKAKDKPLSINVKACTVRKCAIGKGYDCCIECQGLTACEKEVWTEFPKFKEQIIELQKVYRST